MLSLRATAVTAVAVVAAVVGLLVRLPELLQLLFPWRLCLVADATPGATCFQCTVCLSVFFTTSPISPLRRDNEFLQPCHHRKPVRPLFWLLARFVNTDPPCLFPPRHVSIRHITVFAKLISALPFSLLLNAFFMHSISYLFTFLFSFPLGLNFTLLLSSLLLSTHFSLIPPELWRLSSPLAPRELSSPLAPQALFSVLLLALAALLAAFLAPPARSPRSQTPPLVQLS